MIEDIRKIELDCLLKEIDNLQSEMDMRLDRHATAFYICITLLAGVIGGIATAIGKDIAKETILAVLVFIPWLTTPLAAMFFDDELLRGITEIHIHEVIAPQIRYLLQITRYDGNVIFESSLGDRIISLSDLKIKDPRGAANTRRLLFTIPFVLAAGSFLFLSYLLCSHALNSLASFFLVVIPGVGVDVYLGLRLTDMWERASRLWKQIERGDPRLRDLLDGDRTKRRIAERARATRYRRD